MQFQTGFCGGLGAVSSLCPETKEDLKAKLVWEVTGGADGRRNIESGGWCDKTQKALDLLR
jgi:hypothetical protein